MKVLPKQLLTDALRECGNFSEDLSLCVLQNSRKGPFVEVADMVFARILTHFAGTPIGDRLRLAQDNELNKNGINKYYQEFNELSTLYSDLDKWLDSKSVDEFGFEDAAKFFVRYSRLMPKVKDIFCLAVSNLEGNLFNGPDLYCAYNGEEDAYFLVDSKDDKLLIRRIELGSQTSVFKHGPIIAVSPFDLSCWSNNHILTCELIREQLGLKPIYNIRGTK